MVGGAGDGVLSTKGTGPQRSQTAKANFVRMQMFREGGKAREQHRRGWVRALRSSGGFPARVHAVRVAGFTG